MNTKMNPVELNTLRDGIEERIISDNPNVRNFTLSDGAVQKLAKWYQSDVQDMSNEVFRLIGEGPGETKHLTIMHEEGSESL